MSEAHLKRSRIGVATSTTLVTALALALLGLLGTAGPSEAGDRVWRLQFEVLQMDAYGHDQHVLNIHDVLLGPPDVVAKSAVTLDTTDGLAYRGEARTWSGQWGAGIDFFWFTGTQTAAVPPIAADGPGGPVVQTLFEVADQTFLSAGPGEVLFFNVLEDTDLAAWTLDLYGLRTLAEKPKSAIHLQFGLRLADFDNDYRAAVGVQDVVGSRLDASSNYGALLGPILGLEGEARLGRNKIKAYIGQSVVLGEAELSSTARGFTGPFSETVSFFQEELFTTVEEVAIPITELRLKWTYQINDRISVGLGANAAAWFDVSVPPGVLPVEDGQETLHENTIVFYGLLAAVELTL